MTKIVVKQKKHWLTNVKDWVMKKMLFAKTLHWAAVGLHSIINKKKRVEFWKLYDDTQSAFISGFLTSIVVASLAGILVFVFGLGSSAVVFGITIAGPAVIGIVVGTLVLATILATTAFTIYVGIQFIQELLLAKCAGKAPLTLKVLKSLLAEHAGESSLTSKELESLLAKYAGKSFLTSKALDSLLETYAGKLPLKSKDLELLLAKRAGRRSLTAEVLESLFAKHAVKSPITFKALDSLLKEYAVKEPVTSKELDLLLETYAVKSSLISNLMSKKLELLLAKSAVKAPLTVKVLKSLFAEHAGESSLTPEALDSLLKEYAGKSSLTSKALDSLLEKYAGKLFLASKEKELELLLAKYAGRPPVTSKAFWKAFWKRCILSGVKFAGYWWWPAVLPVVLKLLLIAVLPVLGVGVVAVLLAGTLAAVANAFTAAANVWIDFFGDKLPEKISKGSKNIFSIFWEFFKGTIQHIFISLWTFIKTLVSQPWAFLSGALGKVLWNLKIKNPFLHTAVTDTAVPLGKTLGSFINAVSKAIFEAPQKLFTKLREAINKVSKKGGETEKAHNFQNIKTLLEKHPSTINNDESGRKQIIVDDGVSNKTQGEKSEKLVEFNRSNFKVLYKKAKRFKEAKKSPKFFQEKTEGDETNIKHPTEKKEKKAPTFFHKIKEGDEMANDSTEKEKTLEKSDTAMKKGK